MKNLLLCFGLMTFCLDGFCTDVGGIDVDAGNVLVSAMLQNDQSTVEKIINGNENIDSGFFLAPAAGRGYLRVVEKLLARNPDASAKNDALVSAAGSGHIEIVEKLLENGADINAKSRSNSDTALTAATRRGRIEILEKLLENKADVNVKGGGGLTALALAANKGNYKIVEKLLAHDVKADTKNVALMFAIKNNDFSMISILLEDK